MHMLQIVLVSCQMVEFHANDLLDQRIIENGTFLSNMVSGSIVEAIQEMIDLMNVTLDLKRLKIKLQKYSKKQMPRWAKFDKRRLQQILLNLLSNAVKYCKMGEILVTVKMQ